MGPHIIQRDAALDNSDDASAKDASDTDSGDASGDGGSGGTLNTDDAAPAEDADTWNPLLDDCDQPTLQLVLANSAFDRNDQDWQADSNAVKVWSNDDSAGDSSSGSLTLTNKKLEAGMGLNAGSVSQCLEIPRNVGFHVCADYLLNNGVPSTAAASVNLVLFDGEQCSGSVSTSPSIAPQATKGGWQTFKARMNAPPVRSSYKSMLVKLVVIKGSQDAPVDIQFDNVRIGAVPRP